MGKRERGRKKESEREGEGVGVGGREGGKKKEVLRDSR